MWTRRIPFRVDIAGVIEIMGSSLYSRIDTPIRELIQNAHDAIMRRRQLDLTYKGRIDIRQDPAAGTLTFEDDGIGLSPDEAESYLGTLGIGITGLIKGRGTSEQREGVVGDATALIGQFGIGLFSAFMLAEELIVESRRTDHPEGVRWQAGAGTEINISHSPRAASGTSVTLKIKPEFRELVEKPGLIEEAVKLFADFLPVPIFVNDGAARANVINVAWFDSAAEREQMELELQGYFHEAPLDTIPIQINKPKISGALYVTPQRTPGFADDAVVAVTVRRMVISRRIQELLPRWASFLRGVLELGDCSPTASREDLVRNKAFESTKRVLEEQLYQHFEKLVANDRGRFEAIVAWHRYSIAGAALSEERLRKLLMETYRWPTSQGLLTFAEILEKSAADPILESEADAVVWYNCDRRRERWMNELFAQHSAPCVHALRSFEESLFAALVADVQDRVVHLRTASPSTPGFGTLVLGMRDLEDADSRWQEFLGGTCGGVKVLCASYRVEQPAMAFLNDRYELSKTFEELNKADEIPAGFRRLIDDHFRHKPAGQNEVVLNRNHRIVSRAMSQGTGSPLASVLRLLVAGALQSAGAATDRSAIKTQQEDLDWIADALWGKDK